MPLLAADIGNSHTVLGLLASGDVLDHWRVATDVRRTADEWAVLIRGLLADSHVDEVVTGIVICSTVPHVLQEWRDMVRRHFAAFPVVIVENVHIFPGIPELLRKKFDSIRDRFQGVPVLLKRVFVKRMESDIAASLWPRGTARIAPRRISLW